MIFHSDRPGSMISVLSAATGAIAASGFPGAGIGFCFCCCCCVSGARASAGTDVIADTIAIGVNEIRAGLTVTASVTAACVVTNTVTVGIDETCALTSATDALTRAGGVIVTDTIAIGIDERPALDRGLRGIVSGNARDNHERESQREESQYKSEAFHGENLLRD